MASKLRNPPFHSATIESCRMFHVAWRAVLARECDTGHHHYPSKQKCWSPIYSILCVLLHGNNQYQGSTESSDKYRGSSTLRPVLLSTMNVWMNCRSFQNQNEFKAKYQALRQEMRQLWRESTQVNRGRQLSEARARDTAGTMALSHLLPPAPAASSAATTESVTSAEKPHGG